MSGRVTFTAQVSSREARRLRATAARVRPVLADELNRELAPRLVRVSRQAAPERTQALARGLRTRPNRGTLPGVEVVSTVRSAEGYPYTGVTRFGHRKRWIEPIHKKALRTPWGPRRRVRGYRPRGDWADTAHRLAQPHIARSAQRVGRRILSVTG